MRKETKLCLSALLLGSTLSAHSPASSVPPTDAWLKAGGNRYSQNFSPLTLINRQNVASLKAVWRTRLDGSGLGPKYSGEAQPVFYQGVVYIVTGADDCSPPASQPARSSGNTTPTWIPPSPQCAAAGPAAAWRWAKARSSWDSSPTAW